jgi:hypothetical protein
MKRWALYKFGSLSPIYLLACEPSTIVRSSARRSERLSMTSRAVAAAIIDEDPHVYEEKHVHAVYEEIAPHFSSTRYKVS